MRASIERTRNTAMESTPGVTRKSTLGGGIKESSMDWEFLYRGRERRGSMASGRTEKRSDGSQEKRSLLLKAVRSRICVKYSKKTQISALIKSGTLLNSFCLLPTSTRRDSASSVK